MTPLEQNIRIAELCGWTHTKTISNPEPTAYGRAPKGEHPTQFGKEVEWDLPLPPYVDSLDHIAEAESTLTEWEDREYRNELIKMTACGEHRATAAQRATAFLAVKSADGQTI